MQSTSAMEFTGISRRFGDVEALREISLTVERGEFFSLLGPSGCGKTTLLRIIAGLDFPDAGSLHLGGKNLLAIPAHRRPVNTVFQSYALFPHLNVRENVAFGLRMKKVPRPEIDRRVNDIMEMVRVGELAARKPAQISGGEKQRVALARALVNEPEVLLLDEPLGALDLKLRKELQRELRALQRRTAITFIYVTHDQDEALSMSDRIAIMDRGRILQVGAPADLYEKPRTRFVAQFLGGCNVLLAKAGQRSESHVRVQTPLGELKLASADPRREFHVAIRPEKILLHDQGENQFPGVITEVVYTGAETHSMIRVQNEVLRVVSVNAGGRPCPMPGDSVQLVLPAEALVVLED